MKEKETCHLPKKQQDVVLLNVQVAGGEAGRSGA